MPYEDYHLSCFAGLEISISGYARQKSSLARLLNDNGGRYTPQLNRPTCHVLVAEAAPTEKTQ